MKNIFCISILLILAGCDTNAKRKVIARIQSLPTFQVLLMDSTTMLSSHDLVAPNALVMVYFKSDCPSCKKETNSIIQHIKAFGDTRFLFLTSSSFAEMRAFAAQFNLADYSNITVANDHKNAFRDTFRPRSVPYTVVYNRERKLTRVFSSPPSVESFLKAVAATSGEALSQNQTASGSR